MIAFVSLLSSRGGHLYANPLFTEEQIDLYLLWFPSLLNDIPMNFTCLIDLCMGC